jgi:hypothetical protein
LAGKIELHEMRQNSGRVAKGSVEVPLLACPAVSVGTDFSAPMEKSGWQYLAR